MNIKLGQINSIIGALNAVGDLDLPVKISYWFARTAAQLQPEIEPFDKQRIKLLKKYSKVDKKGELILDDNQQAQLKDPEAFAEDYAKFAKEEINVKMKKISIEKLGEVNIKPAIMAALLPLFLKEGENEEDE